MDKPTVPSSETEPALEPIRFTLRLDADLHAWLIQHAQDQNRTLSGQIRQILEEYRQRTNTTT
jgi:hypothetical protein